MKIKKVDEFGKVTEELDMADPKNKLNKNIVDSRLQNIEIKKELKAAINQLLRVIDKL